MAIKRLSTRLLAAALIGAFVLPTVTATSADAKDRRHGWHKRHDNWHGDRRNRHHRHHKRDRGGDAAAAIALGVIGLAAGAAIASAANQPDYIDPPYDPDYGYGYGPAEAHTSTRLTGAPVSASHTIRKHRPSCRVRSNRGRPSGTPIVPTSTAALTHEAGPTRPTRAQSDFVAEPMAVPR